LAVEITWRHDAGEPRILAGVFEGSAVARLARQVAAAGQKHVEALRVRLGPDHRPAGIGQPGIPGRRHGQHRRQRRGAIAGAHLAAVGDAEARVGFL
jgi:hypothetical protein